jgi:hydrogenase nickel incorporation protein HypB
MCATCGCSELVHDHDHTHDHDHDHDNDHDHDHDHDHEHDDHDHDHEHEHRVKQLEIDVLAKSRRLAADNRAFLKARGVRMINLMSAPGAGKTTLLERTVSDLKNEIRIAVIEGDQSTTLDADRIRRAGAPSVQINTGAGCHLDPHMVRHGLEDLRVEPGMLVIVENVGNLVCPALFDLGEELRIVLLSVPEGDDKPLKYPHMFATADVVLLTKVDLLPYVPFDVARCEAAIREVAPQAKILHVSHVSTKTELTSFYDEVLRKRSGQPS